MPSPKSHATTRTSSDQLFLTLEERLKGLLYMEVDGTFLDREHRCVSQVALVVSLDLVVPEKKETLPRALQQTLDAVATLCVYSEGLRDNENQFNAFWMRVFASNMVKSSWVALNELPSIQSTLRCLYAVGFHVKLSWQDQPLVPFVIEAIRGFLQPYDKYEHRVALDAAGSGRPSVQIRPLQVAIELSNCQLKETHVKRLMEALKVPEQITTLCEREMVRALHLAGNPLDTAELNAIAKLLESSSTRRIDSLGLIDAMPLDATRASSNQYTKAFKRVMVAAFRSKIAAHNDHGFALSLAGNGGLRPSHIVALHEALAGSGVTRPLQALSFAGIYLDSDATWAQIGKLLFDSSAALAITMKDKCELTLSATGGHASILVGLTQLVRAARSQIIRALQDHVPVYCRVLGRTPATKELSRSTLYKVVGVSRNSGNSFLIQVPHAPRESPPTIVTDSINHVDERAEPVVLKWLTTDEISFVRIGDTDSIRSRFSRLVLDSNDIYNDKPSVLLLEAMGQDLRCIALRDYRRLYEFIGPVLARCPRLEELNLDYSHIQDRGRRAVPLWPKLTSENWRSLQVFSAVASHISNDSLSTLLSTLAGVPDLALQHLCFGEDTTFNAQRLRTVGDIIRQNKSIQEITIGCSFLNFDVARGVWKNESAENAVLRDQIDQELRVEGLSVESRLAFLSVLPRLPSAVQQHLDTGVIAEIFRFADAKKARKVTWY